MADTPTSCYFGHIVWECGYKADEDILCRCVSDIGRPCPGDLDRIAHRDRDLGVIALMHLWQDCEHFSTCLPCRRYGPYACMERDTTGMYP